MSEGAAADERVVLGRKDDSTWVGFQWTGQEPEALTDVDEAEAMGAVWEDDELVTYDLPALSRQAERSKDGWLRTTTDVRQEPWEGSHGSASTPDLGPP